MSPAVLFSNSEWPKSCARFFSLPVSHDLDERNRYECLETIEFDPVEKLKKLSVILGSGIKSFVGFKSRLTGTAASSDKNAIFTNSFFMYWFSAN